MRRILVVLLIGSTIALFVYVAATTTDAHVGTLTKAVQTALQSEGGVDLGEHFAWRDDGILDTLIFLTVLLLLFGGLPVAIFGLAGHREWTRPAGQRLLFAHVPYAVLLFQIVSVLWSTIWLVVLTPRVVAVLSLGIVEGHDLFLPTYLIAQFATGLAAIPVWRRHMLDVPMARRRTLFPNGVYGV